MKYNIKTETTDAIFIQRFLRKLKRRQSAYPKPPRKNAAKKPPVNWTLGTPPITIHVHKGILTLINQTVDQYNRDHPDAPPMNRSTLAQHALTSTMQINTIYQFTGTRGITTMLAQKFGGTPPPIPEGNPRPHPITQALFCTTIHILPCTRSTYTRTHHRIQAVIPIYLANDVTDLLDQSINHYNRDYPDSPISRSILAQDALVAILRLNKTFRSGGQIGINAELTHPTKRPPNFILAPGTENSPKAPITLTITAPISENHIQNNEKQYPNVYPNTIFQNEHQRQNSTPEFT